MPARTTIALDIGRKRVRALLGRRDGALLQVQKVFAEDVPEDIAADDADALGQWIGKQLKQQGFPRARTTIALARQHVGLKRLTLPTIDEHELPEMTRLAMQRQLPFDAETAVIDFLPMQRTESSTTVLAVAVPQAILDQALRTARAARLPVSRVSLRGMGSALLLKHLGEDTQESILAIDVLNDAIEFCVIDDGAIRFSRSAELTDGGHGPESIITETRRTWMSYRIAEDSSSLRHVVIVGDAELGKEVAEPLTRLLKVDAEVLQHHPLVSPNGCEMSRVWPLAGLLLEASHGGETIDFAKPRKAPDKAANRRKRSLMAAGLAVLVLLAGWTFTKRDLDGLERQVRDMESRLAQLNPERLAFNRDAARYRHIELWESASPDWLEHLTYLTTLSPVAPGADRLVLDGWSANANVSNVQYDRRSREWSVPRTFTIGLNGEAVDRATADLLREALVQAEMYSTSSTGADAEGGRRLPFGFSYRLHTTDSSPAGESTVDGEPDEEPASEERPNQP